MVMLVLSDSDEGMEAVEDVLSVDRQEGWRSSPPNMSVIAVKMIEHRWNLDIANSFISVRCCFFIPFRNGRQRRPVRWRPFLNPRADAHFGG